MTYWFDKIMTHLAEKPSTGVLTWFIGWVGSFIPETSFAKGMLFIQTETVVKSNLLWALQMASLTIGSIAGILTIVTLVCKLSDRNRRNKHEVNTYKKK